MKWLIWTLEQRIYKNMWYQKKTQKNEVLKERKKKKKKRREGGRVEGRKGHVKVIQLPFSQGLKLKQFEQ